MKGKKDTYTNVEVLNLVSELDQKSVKWEALRAVAKCYSSFCPRTGNSVHSKRLIFRKIEFALKQTVRN